MASAPRIPADAICYICRDDASREGLVSGCGCHGGDGIAHMSCLVRMAQLAVQDDRHLGHRKWQDCSICGLSFHTTVGDALGWACWKSYLGRPERDDARVQAIAVLGMALRNTDARAALPILEVYHANLRRHYPAAKENISCVRSEIAVCLNQLGRHGEALHLQRAVYAERKSLYGSMSERTIRAKFNLSSGLLNSCLFSEANTFARQQLGFARRTLGESHEMTIGLSDHIATGLSKNPNASRDDLMEAEAIFADVIKRSRIFLGPRHPRTECTVANIALVRQKLARVTTRR